jgi:hypothetical protein
MTTFWDAVESDFIISEVHCGLTKTAIEMMKIDLDRWRLKDNTLLEVEMDSLKEAKAYFERKRII